MNLRDKFKVTARNRKIIGGYLFTLPFTLGFIFFFLYPFIQSVIFSLNELVLSSTGYSLDFVGLDNYHYALFIDTEFARTFVETIADMLVDLPLILAFSLFAAVILNQKFKGRWLARIIFFLPVIYGAGIVMKLEMEDYVTQITMNSDALVFSGDALLALLSEMKFLPSGLIEYILMAVENIPSIIRSSGIQILIFLAGLQSISPSVYEAARVEGATGWESFWLITFPMISPLLLTNTVYTIVDTLTRADNPLVQMIRDATFSGKGYGVSTAMSSLYFLAIALLLGLVFKLISGYVFYRE